MGSVATTSSGLPAPVEASKEGLWSKEYAMRDSNPQPPDSKSDTLSIAPTAPRKRSYTPTQTARRNPNSDAHNTYSHTRHPSSYTTNRYTTQSAPPYPLHTVIVDILLDNAHNSDQQTQQQTDLSVYLTLTSIYTASIPVVQRFVLQLVVILMFGSTSGKKGYPCLYKVVLWLCGSSL